MIKLSKKERLIVNVMKRCPRGNISLDEILRELVPPYSERKHQRSAMSVTISKLSAKLRLHFGADVIVRHTKLGRANKSEFLISGLINEI